MPKKTEYILFVTRVTPSGILAVSQCNTRLKRNFKILLIRDKNISHSYKEDKKAYKVITCDFEKPHAIEKALQPYKESIAATTFYGDENAVLAAKIFPHVPYLLHTSAPSLEWSTDKIAMRQLFEAHDNTITPAFTVVKNTEEKSIARIIKKVGFPLVIKPSGLAASLLVTMCYHEEELKKALQKTFKKIEKIYKENNRTTVPKVLVEQFMEGEMYSVDAYVTSKGDVSFCPMVYVKTGKTIGFDDFFNYMRITPTQLKDSTIEKAHLVARKAIHAVNLRSTTVHIELMRTEDGWKIIELGPRIGGFRNDMYKLSHNIEHRMNDLLLHLGEKPIIPKKRQAYVSVLKMYAQKEGILEKIEGIRKIKKLESLKEIRMNLQPGDTCLYSKHGGKAVCDIILAHKNRSQLLADIRRSEQLIHIKLA